MLLEKNAMNRAGSVAVRNSARRKAGGADCLCSQGIELVCGGRDLPVRTVELPLFDHVHDLDTGDQNARTMERLEAEHGTDNALDGPMLLFDDVVQMSANQHIPSGTVAMRHNQSPNVWVQSHLCVIMN